MTNLKIKAISQTINKKNSCYLFFVIVLFVLLQIIPIYTFMPGTDDGFYAVLARSLVYKQNFSASLYLKDYGFDKYSFYIFPTISAIQAIWANLFGFGLEVLRFMTLFVSGLSLITFFKSLEQVQGKNKQALFWQLIIISSLAFSLTYMRISRTIRPEVFLFLFLNLTFFFYLKAKNNQRYLLPAALTSVLGVFCHTLGFLIAIDLVLLFFMTQRNLKGFINLVYGALIGLVLIGIYFALTDVGYFFKQSQFISYTYDLRGLKYDIWSQVTNWWNYFFSYYGGHRVFELIPYALFVSLLYITKLDRLKKSLLFAILINLVVLISIYPNKFPDYTFTFIYPYVLFFIYLVVPSLKCLNKYFGFVLVGLILLNGMSALYNVKRGLEYGPYSEFKTQIRTLITHEHKISENTVLLGNAQFLFSFPEAQLYDIQIIRDYMELKGIHTLDEIMNQLQVNYIIVDDSFKFLPQIWPLWPAFGPQDKVDNLLKSSKLFGSVRWGGKEYSIYQYSHAQTEFRNK